VRLAPEDAATLYTLVAEAGMANTTVVIKGGAGGPLTRKPAQRLVENPPQQLVEDLPLQLLGKPRKRLVEIPQQSSENRQYRRPRRADDPFLWRDSFN
jgi:hypothetical protein